MSLVADGRDMRDHPKTDELRLFYFDGDVLVPPRATFRPPASNYAELDARAGRFRRQFITLDVAPTLDGSWTTIERGDAGVSGLRVSMMADDFYAARSRAWSASGDGGRERAE